MMRVARVIFFSIQTFKRIPTVHIWFIRVVTFIVPPLYYFFSRESTRVTGGGRKWKFFLLTIWRGISVRWMPWHSWQQHMPYNFSCISLYYYCCCCCCYRGLLVLLVVVAREKKSSTLTQVTKKQMTFWDASALLIIGQIHSSLNFSVRMAIGST